MTIDEQLETLQRAIDALPDEPEAHLFAEDPAYFAEELCGQYEIESDDDARKIISVFYVEHCKATDDEYRYSDPSTYAYVDWKKNEEILRQYRRPRRIFVQSL